MYNKRAHTNGRKGNARAFRQGDQRNNTMEFHRTPTQKFTLKTGGKAEQQ